MQYDISQNLDTKQGAYGIWNASVALADYSDGWRVALLAKNLADKSYSPMLASGGNYITAPYPVTMNVTSACNCARISSMSRQLKLGAFLMATGHHVAAWRHPDVPANAGLDFAQYKHLARVAEAARFDARCS